MSELLYLLFHFGNIVIFERHHKPTMQDIYIETERLIIRPLNMGDDKGMFAMDSDPLVHKFVGNKPVEKIEQSRDTIAFVMQQYEDFGIGRWAVAEKATNDFMGWVGHKYMKGPVNGHSDYDDFGYRLARRFWGKGYATESGKAALDYGISNLGMKDIYAMTDINNKASRHVLEKLGFRYTGNFNYDAEPNWRTPGELTTWYKYGD